MGNNEGDGEIYHRTDRTKGFGTDAEEPIRIHPSQKIGARYEKNPFMLEYVKERDADAGDHPGDGALAIHAFGEDAEHEHREN